MHFPIGNVGLQGRRRGLRITPGLGGQHLDALRQQDSRLALDLHPMLQVLDSLDPVGQPDFQRRQRFTAQRCARFGRIALPRQCVGDVELGR